MKWAQTNTIIGTIIAAVTVLTTFMFFMFTRLDNDIRSQVSRIDQLYTMFIDLLKERK